MTHRLIVLDEAEREIVSAEDWYEEQRAGLGAEFRQAVDEAMSRLAESPALAALAPNVPPSVGVRTAYLKRFPYSVVFVEHGKELWVVAIAHQHRRPGYWRQRIRRSSSP